MSQEQLREALQRVRDRFFPESQPERDRDELWQLVNDALATQPEEAKCSEVDELVSLLAACRVIAARLAPGVADDLLMHAVGGPSEVPAYIEGVISELTHHAPAASAEREARVIEQNARKAAQEQLYAERERHTAEVKRLQAEIGRLKAPAASVSDEREAFEAEMRCEEVWGHRSLVTRPDGRYQNWQVNAMWDVWQARAALRPAQAGVPEGFPEFDQLEDEVIDAACAAGSIYRVDLMRAYECMRAMLAAAPTKDHP